jgi:hypothetical protein
MRARNACTRASAGLSNLAFAEYVFQAKITDHPAAFPVNNDGVLAADPTASVVDCHHVRPSSVTMTRAGTLTSRARQIRRSPKFSRIAISVASGSLPGF